MDKTNRILFEKPDLAELTANYTVADLHFHSRYSDGVSKVEDIAHRAAELGIGIAITDHNEIGGAVEIARHKDVLSIPGIELTSREGSHLLVYFYDIRSMKQFYTRDVKPFMGNGVMQSMSLEMEEIISRARAFETVIIFPHPYSVAYTGICNLTFSKEHLARLLDMVDGVEVINSQNMNKWNLRCAVLGFNLDKAITGGSDGHLIHHLGRTVSYCACEKSRRAFLDSIKKRQNRVVGKEIDIFRKVTSHSIKLRSNIRNYPDIVEKNIKYGRRVINLRSRNLMDNVKRTIDEKIAKMQKR